MSPERSLLLYRETIGKGEKKYNRPDGRELYIIAEPPQGIFRLPANGGWQLAGGQGAAALPPPYSEIF